MRACKAPPKRKLRKIDVLAKRLTTFEEFVAIHIEYEKLVTTYLDAPRSNYRRLAKDVRAKREKSEAAAMWSINIHSRIRFARIMRDELVGIAETHQHEPLLWITLIPRKFVVREAEASAFSIRRITSWTHEALRGHSYIGIIEAALYSNPGQEFAPGRAVSWHVHVVMFGTSKEDFRNVKNRVNERNMTLLPKMNTAWCEAVEPSEVERISVYMSKIPLRDHRIYPKMKTLVDQQTGEIRKMPTGSMRQKKPVLRTGDMVRFCDIMAHLTLPNLLFGGGDGLPIVRRIRKRALGSIKR